MSLHAETTPGGKPDVDMHKRVWTSGDRPKPRTFRRGSTWQQLLDDFASGKRVGLSANQAATIASALRTNMAVVINTRHDMLVCDAMQSNGWGVIVEHEFHLHDSPPVWCGR